MESTVIGDFRCLYQKKNANRKPVPQLYVKNGWMCGHFVFRRRTFWQIPRIER